MQIHERIKALREQRGLSQEALALQVGYRDRSSIAKVEAGKVDLSQSKIAAFAAALDVTPAELLGWGEAQAKLQSAGMTLADTAQEMGLPLEALKSALHSKTHADAAEKIIAVAKALADTGTDADTAVTPREMALILLYRAASAKDRTVVDTVLGLEEPN